MPEPFQTLTSRTVVLSQESIDTDQIIPARFLTTTSRDGLGDKAFYDWRYDGNGKARKDALLNQIDPHEHRVLVAGDNFACGSSREHAPWALEEYGFRAVIAPSFADIFYNNSFKNGLLPIVLEHDEVDALFAQCEASEGYALTVDLAAQTVTRPDGVHYRFEVDAFRKHCLLNGLDDIGLTLQRADAVRAFETRHRAAQPWLFG